MAREQYAMITFNDAQYMANYEGYTALDTIPSSEQLMTRSAIEYYLDVDTTNFSGYGSDELVPYHLIQPAEVTINTAWRPIDQYCIQEEEPQIVLTQVELSSSWNNDSDSLGGEVSCSYHNDANYHQTFWVDNGSLANATAIYKDSTGNTFADRGFYADGNVARKWTGEAFTSFTQSC